ncbi:MAG: transporter substrate-binding domain-containing protein [Ruminococcaceae bacterium]|nr:transporter substrate-binding domain-containing protein [Oscillospiraceae bacterium]
MKRIIALVMAVLMMSVVFVGCGSASDSTSDLQYITDKGTLVVGITDYAPMNYKDDNGEWTGFDTEFALLVGEKLGVEVEFIEINWDNKFLELDSKSIDCIWNGMTITEEATLNSSVSDPYVENAQVVVMTAENADKYTDADSMADLSFAAEAGSAGEATITENGWANYTAVKAQSDALLEVASGSSDACVIDITMANAMTGEGTSYEDLVQALKLNTEQYGIACRKDSDLTAKINEIMSELKGDGTLEALAQKYELALVK